MAATGANLVGSGVALSASRFSSAARIVSASAKNGPPSARKARVAARAAAQLATFKVGRDP